MPKQPEQAQVQVQSKITANIKEKPLTTLVPVIKAPELIKVKTINPRIVEALEWRTSWSYSDLRFDWTNQEIIGRLVPTGILTRNAQTGEICKVNEIIYIEGRQDYLRTQGVEHIAANQQAQEEIRAFPQVFPA